MPLTEKEFEDQMEHTAWLNSLTSQTTLPFEIAKGDGDLIAKALRAYRPETSEEEAIVHFFIEQFEKLDASSK